jgi:hypothetical protein
MHRQSFSAALDQKYLLGISFSQNVRSSTLCLRPGRCQVMLHTGNRMDGLCNFNIGAMKAQGIAGFVGRLEEEVTKASSIQFQSYHTTHRSKPWIHPQSQVTGKAMSQTSTRLHVDTFIKRKQRSSTSFLSLNDLSKLVYQYGPVSMAFSVCNVYMIWIII